MKLFGSRNHATIGFVWIGLERKFIFSYYVGETLHDRQLVSSIYILLNFQFARITNIGSTSHAPHFTIDFNVCVFSCCSLVFLSSHPMYRYTRIHWFGTLTQNSMTFILHTQAIVNTEQWARTSECTAHITVKMYLCESTTLSPIKLCSLFRLSILDLMFFEFHLQKKVWKVLLPARMERYDYTGGTFNWSRHTHKCKRTSLWYHILT